MKTIYIGMRSPYLGAKIDLKEWLFGVSFDIFSEEDRNVEEPGFMLNIGIGPLIVILAIPFINKLQIRANSESLGAFIESVQTEGLGVSNQRMKRFVCGNRRTLKRSLKNACTILGSKASIVERIDDSNLAFELPGVTENYRAIVNANPGEYTVSFIPADQSREEVKSNDESNSPRG